jgi:uncharacterized protein (DUF362 family)
VFSARSLVAVVFAFGIFGCSRDRRDGVADGGSLPVPSSSAPLPAVASSAPVDTVTSASTRSSDAGAIVVGAEVVDGAALRERHRARIAADTSAVTVLEGGGPRALGMRLCEAVVPARPKETPILIKPNIGGFDWFKDPTKNDGDDGVRGRTTDSEFVRGIVQCLKARGHRKITIAEGWGAKHADWKRLVRVSGYEKMASEEAVPLVAMDDDGVFDVTGDRPGRAVRVTGMEATNTPTILLPKLLADHLEHGMFISAPKIKAHRFGVVSMAIKGMQGTVMLSDEAPAFRQKWRMHKELTPALELLKTDRVRGEKAYLDALHVFAERMVDVLELSAPDVVLAEGAPAMGGDGFGKRWPSTEDVAVGGTNPVLVDRVGAALLGLWDNADLARALGGHRTSPLIEAAAKRFSVDIAQPKLEGNGAALLARPRPVHFVSMSGFELHSDAQPATKTWGREGSSPPDGDAGAPREARAHRVEKAITVDGAIDEEWRAATPVSFTTDWSGTDTGIRTSARFAWNKRALWIAWELEGAGVNVDAERPIETERAKLYEEDCVELFLAPDAAERSRYFEVEVGPLGHFLDIAIDRTKKRASERGSASSHDRVPGGEAASASGTRESEVGWSSKPVIATKVDRAAHKVTIEMELRAPEIVGALRSGANLPLGLYRMEGKSPRKFLAWSPTRTPKPNFHVPEAFGTLRME